MCTMVLEMRTQGSSEGPLLLVILLESIVALEKCLGSWSPVILQCQPRLVVMRPPQTKHGAWTEGEC